MKPDSIALPMADRLFAGAVLLVLVFASQPLLLSGHSLQQSTPKSGTIHPSSATAPKGNGVIVGIVVNERHEPVAYAIVQAFSADNSRDPQGKESVQRRSGTSGSATTDAEGHFVISGLPLGEYLVAAEPAFLFPDRGRVPSGLYGATFYPSTLDDHEAVSVSAFSYPATTIQIELVPVRGMRIAGSVVSGSGRPIGGLGVRLFRRFGGFGAESNIAVVSAEGTFEILGVPPGWYRLTVGQPPSESGANGEFADTLIEVRDGDLDGLALVLGPGASVSGRIVAEPGTSLRTSVGLRVNASVAPEQYSAWRVISATVADNWSFRLTGLSGSYQFSVSADRAPAVIATRITVDGVQAPASAAVELAEGGHELVIFVALREAPKPIFDGTGLSSGALVEQFKNEKVFWRQFAIAKEIVERQEPSILSALVGWLSHEDRHVRGNVAFIFGSLGDVRGLQVITDILTDRSERAEGQGGAPASSDGRYHVARQIAADRYYAAHLLGDLRDPRAIPVLLPLLKDAETNSIVPWALGQIGDKRAVGPLLDALDDESATTRVLAIYALETLHAKEALPRLIPLLNDDRKSNFGAQVSVAAAAKAAIANLQ